MKSRWLLFLSVLFFAEILCAQVDPQKESDTITLTPNEIKLKEIDSLVKFIRSAYYQNDYHETIEVGEKTLKLAEELKDYPSVLRISSLMGNAFLQLEDTVQAKRIFLKTIKDAEERKDTIRNLITAQIDLGNYYALQEKRPEAIEIYSKALPLAQKLQDTVSLFILNFNIAELNLDVEDIPKAEYFVNQTNSYITKNTAEAYKAVAKLNLGKLYFLKGSYALAKKDLSISIEKATSSGYTDPLIEGYEFLSEAEAKLGNFEAAFDLRKKADFYKSENYKVDKINAIETVTAKFKLNQYQQDLKAQEIQSEYNRQTAKRETTILWIKIASGILLISSIFLLIAARKRKKLLVDLTIKNKQYLEAKERSEELSKAKSILFSNITHELRTPMYGIIGVSSILTEDKKIKGHGENLKSLKFSAHYLLSLINNVLQITQIDSTSKEGLAKVEFNLRDLINNVIGSSKFINPDGNNKYAISLDDTIPTLLIGDEIKLSQILINLIGNSSKFTHNGTIETNVKRMPDNDGKVCLSFTIVDDGIGISEDKQANLYNEFSQTLSGDTYHGTGLGLPIVKKILDLHNSEINLKSDLGEGTTINFELCYKAVETANQEINLNEVPNDSILLDGMHILSVDDNQINQIVTSKILKLYGATVSVAGGGADAIEMARENTFDLILMDINMPEVDGFQATVAIRSFNAEIPIIALTAVEPEKVTGEHSFSLMNDLIIKPYPKDVFISTILKHIKRTP